MCALEKELVRTMNGPAIRGYAAKAVTAAQKDHEALQNANATMTASIAILSPLMRSQHVIALAFAKQCSWMIGAVPLARVTPPR